MSRVRTAFPRSSEITPRDVFDQRRSFLRDAGFVIAAAGAASLGLGFPRDAAAGTFSSARKGPYGTTEAPTPLKDVTSYNNFYEFGTGKDPIRRSAPAA
jgi:sulfoxide reductase catalytic subunit YedY